MLFQQPLGAFEGGLTGGAAISLRYIVKFEHGYYEAYSDQTCSCKGKQVINLGQSIILASKFCSFPGKIGKHQGHFSLIHWNLLSENQPGSRRSLLHPFLIVADVFDYIDLLRGRGRSGHLRLALLLFTPYHRTPRT